MGESKITINNHCPPLLPSLFFSSILLIQSSHSLSPSPVEFTFNSIPNPFPTSPRLSPQPPTTNLISPKNHKHAVSIPSDPPTLLRRFPPIHLSPGLRANAFQSPEDPSPIAALREAKISNSPSFLLQTPHSPKAPDLQAHARPLPPRW